MKKEVDQKIYVYFFVLIPFLSTVFQTLSFVYFFFIVSSP